jgi:hypothetical protein
MWKRLSLSLLLFTCFFWTAIRTEAAQFDNLDNKSILRFIYPNQTLTSDPQKDPNQIQRFQVGSVENHTAAVLNRLAGKFTQPDQPELIAIVGVDTGSDSASPVSTGIYALLLRLDKGNPQLIVRSAILQRKTAPFGSKLWRPVIATDVDFDKQDDLIMMESDTRTGAEHYSIYRWGGKDFVNIPDHPAIALLEFYAHLDAAAHQSAEQGPSGAQLNAAYEKFSPKLQSLQTVDSLRNRLQEAKGVEIDNFKVMIRGETSALIRLQYSLLGAEGGSTRQFQADYQVRRFGDKWQLDSERLKVVSSQGEKEK